jgi:hypothetical protein
MAVLRGLTYEDCIEINGGEHCGICGAVPKTRRLDRDHEHKGNGALRGLLCIRCNLALPNRITIEWLKLAIAYLERFEERKGTSGTGHEHHRGGPSLQTRDSARSTGDA